MFQRKNIQDFFGFTRNRLILYGLGFLFLGFLTLVFPYLLIGVVVTILFMIGGLFFYLAWKFNQASHNTDDTIIIEHRDDDSQL